MNSPILYVLAGPNGIGKTTSTYDLIPKNIPVINSDEIAKLAKLAGIVNTNTQEYSNREAMKLVQENLDKRLSFGIETNLSDLDTWKFLIGIQKTGYNIHLLFLSTDDIGLLNKRIEERRQRGEHYVTPKIVEERYLAGLKLLDHYFDVPEKIVLIDNSDFPVIIAEKISGSVIVKQPLKIWVKTYINRHFVSSTIKTRQVKDLSSKEEVKELYKKHLSHKKPDKENGKKGKE